MDLKEHTIRLAAEQGYALEWDAVTDAAAYDPEPVVEVLATHHLDAGVESVAEDLIRVCAAYQSAGRQPDKSRRQFIDAARRLAGAS